MDRGIEAALDRYGELLRSSPVSLMSRAARAVARTRHIDEAQHVVDALGVGRGQRWLDIGTGGGLPGIVLAIMHPEADVTLVDSTKRKVQEVARFVEELGLQNVETVWGRAEQLARQPAHRCAFDGVICRAVGRLAVVAELGRGFIDAGGRIVVVKGPAWADEREGLNEALESLALAFRGAHRVPSAPTETWLVEFTAQGETPDWVPRRVGVPEHRPLG